MPADWNRERILLHFGAVDWNTIVEVNGAVVGRHRGGYTPFDLDITDHLHWDRPNEVVVGVTDPTDQGMQPIGKQHLVPTGIRYTAVSGIWQSVWLEPVPSASIRDLRVTPDVDSGTLRVVATGRNTSDAEYFEAEIREGDAVVTDGKARIGQPLILEIAEAKLWSPDEPFLYDLRVRLIKDDKVIDEVGSYFGMRSIKLGKDKNGLTRIMFNGRPVFQLGILDQGYWPDGLYTPPSDAAVRHELKVAKRLGFNMVRKHMKVEAARWYYWCDKIGLLVWQDMPSGDQKAQWPRDGLEISRSGESAGQFRDELKAMVDFCHAFPSVVMWIPFNEAWGQFNTRAITAWLKEYDPSRLVISASGGNDFGVGDARDVHFYPGPGMPPAERRRAAVLGEFGGYGLPVEEHAWQAEESWAYRSVTSKAELASAYTDLLERLRPQIESHLSAAIYTQLTDVETEVNGLFTYNREVLKIDEATLIASNRAATRPLPTLSDEERLTAPTLAWWRFEEGTPGAPIPNIKDQKGAIGAYDSSGHNNHLYAASSHTAPRTGVVSYIATPRFHSSGNRYVLDDTRPASNGVLSRDLFTAWLLSRTRMNALDSYPLSEWTIEASFALSDESGTQVILSKRGSFSQTPHPCFQMGVFQPDATIQVQMIDGDGKLRVVRGDRPAQVGSWYHVAATCDNDSLKLYIRPDGDTDYRLVDECQAKGGLVRSIGNWSLGRGFYDGQMDFDARAQIDEVRISVTARPKADFLFAP